METQSFHRISPYLCSISIKLSFFLYYYFYCFLVLPQPSMLRNNQILVTESGCIERDSIYLPEPQQITQHVKRPLNGIVYIINLLMMVCIPPVTVFLLFWSTKNLQLKAYFGFGLIGICILGMIITSINLRVGPVKIFKTFIILDSLVLAFGVTSLAFVGMMYFLDRGRWEMKVLQVAYLFCSVTKILNLRILLLYMKWKRLEVIIYKIVLMIMALTYFSVGVYCFYTNYSFTFNILKKFDQQCRYFVVLFTFAAFDFCGRLIRQMGSFDYTEKFKYVYVIKDVRKERVNKHEQMVKSFRNLDVKKKEKRSVHLIPVVKFETK